jgi:hypothetical protein
VLFLGAALRYILALHPSGAALTRPFYDP